MPGTDSFLFIVSYCGLCRCVLLAMQNLLRGLLPDSFPARLAAEPSTEKQRRFIIIDEAVHAIYGPQLEKVHTHQYVSCFFSCQLK